jgi:uncharacterized membrane protein
MSAIEESVEVHADTQRAYEMMTEFDHYPDFMGGLEEVRRTGETVMHWVSHWDGQRHEWDSQVVQMDPEERIVFQSLHREPPVLNTLTFQTVGAGTRITWTLENDPGPEEAVRAQLRQDLQRLKEIMEEGPPTRWPG